MLQARIIQCPSVNSTPIFKNQVYIMTQYKGGCLCGQVRYNFLSHRLDAVSCYCRDCQRVTGSPMTTVVQADANSLVTDGQTKTYSVQSASNRTVTRHFCPTCGSQLFTEAEMVPDAIFIKCSTLDEPSNASTKANFWLSSAASWAPVNKNLPCFDQNPVD